jgi:EAL domain-containing protein (putative c-di-GMP-specific phosphodiesterase class I)
MRTISMPERTVGLAWLERFSEEGGSPEKTMLERFPFVLGRGETADLQINSSRVSREHAVLVHEEREYRIRDLGSTNGTLVNGQRIQEAVLHHGDMLVLANVEFTFGCGHPESSQRTVTQLLDCETPERFGRGVPDFRYAVRRLHEVLVRGCVQNSFDAIVRLSGGQVFGYEARGEDPGAPAEAESVVWTAPWPVAARVRQLRRVSAVEASRACPGDPVIFLRIDACDLGMRGLVDTIAGLGRLLNNGRRLVAVLPPEALRDAGPGKELAHPLRDAGVGVALDGITGKPNELLRLAEGPFDYLKVAGPLVRGIQRSPDRQRLIETAVRAGCDGGWQVIATGIRDQEERDACDGLGCSFGQGPLFANLRPAASRHLRESARSES